MQLQKEVKSNPAVKKVCSPEDGHCENVKSKVAAKKQLWWWGNGKNFNNDNSGEFGAKS